MIGKTLGPYEILALIGTGGMGEGWKAWETLLGCLVAIKILYKEHMQRFKREARHRDAARRPYSNRLPESASLESSGSA